MEKFEDRDFRYLNIDITKEFVVIPEIPSTGSQIKQGDVLTLLDAWESINYGRFLVKREGKQVTITEVYWRDLYYNDETKPINIINRILSGARR